MFLKVFFEYNNVYLPFINSFYMVDLIDIPKTFSRITGEEEGVDDIINDFFINSRKHIESKVKRESPIYFEIDSASLAYGSNHVNSNDRVTYLKLDDRYVVAGVIETRTAYNSIQYSFFRDLSCLEEFA